MIMLYTQDIVNHCCLLFLVMSDEECSCIQMLMLSACNIVNDCCLSFFVLKNVEDIILQP